MAKWKTRKCERRNPISATNRRGSTSLFLSLSRPAMLFITAALLLAAVACLTHAPGMASSSSSPRTLGSHLIHYSLRPGRGFNASEARDAGAINRSHNLRALNVTKRDNLHQPTTSVSTYIMALNIVGFKWPRMYAMPLRLGSSQQMIYVMVDSGSDVVWVTCNESLAKSRRISFFNDNSSYSYKSVPCESPKCIMDSSMLCRFHKQCIFSLLYGSLDSASGTIGLETLTMLDMHHGVNRPFPDFTIGCAQTGRFNYPGVAGFNRDPLSFPSQLAENYDIDNIFSYCLVPMESTYQRSPLVFGSAALLYAQGMKSISMLDSRFYYVNLQQIRFDNAPPIYMQELTSPTPTLFDTGSASTYIPMEAYQIVAHIVLNEFSSYRTIDLPGTGLRLCKYILHYPFVYFPKVDLVFEENVTMTLPMENIFHHFTEENVVCLAILPSSDVHGFPQTSSIIGSIMQQQFRFVIDNVSKRIYMGPEDCTKSRILPNY